MSGDDRIYGEVQAVEERLRAVEGIVEREVATALVNRPLYRNNFNELKAGNKAVRDELHAVSTELIEKIDQNSERLKRLEATLEKTFLIARFLRVTASVLAAIGATVVFISGYWEQIVSAAEAWRDGNSKEP